MAHLNSLDFLAFLAVVITLLRILGRGRTTALLGVSLFFLIVASNEYVALGLLSLAVGCYWIGSALPRIASRKVSLAIVVPTLIAVWCFVVVSSRYDWLQSLGIMLTASFPFAQELRIQSAIVAWASRVGVSFLALRLSSFLVDSLVRREQLPFAVYMNYLFYFPGLLAGPIDRPWNFYEKLKLWQHPSCKDYISGADRFLTGLCKKFVLADLLLPYTIADLPVDSASHVQLLVGWIAYSAYIYWEFSGYTDMVIGVSRILGIVLPENFDRPYFKEDITQFWNSWHMSFSSWLRDYIFTPLNLTISRKLRSPHALTPVPALVATMLVCGLWHGYTLGLLVWGLHHGFGLSAHRVYQELMRRRLGRATYRQLAEGKIYRLISWLATFSFVTFGWVWFALPLDSAMQCIGRLVDILP